MPLLLPNAGLRLAPTTLSMLTTMVLLLPTGYIAIFLCCLTAWIIRINKLPIFILPGAGGWPTFLSALQAGMTNFESTLGGIGGQPANFVDGVPVAGTGDYYYNDPNDVGLVSTEDMAIMMDEMGIETNLDLDRILRVAKL